MKDVLLNIFQNLITYLIYFNLLYSAPLKIHIYIYTLPFRHEIFFLFVLLVNLCKIVQDKSCHLRLTNYHAMNAEPEFLQCSGRHGELRQQRLNLQGQGQNPQGQGDLKLVPRTRITNTA